MFRLLHFAESVQNTMFWYVRVRINDQDVIVNKDVATCLGAAFVLLLHPSESLLIILYFAKFTSSSRSFNDLELMIHCIGDIQRVVHVGRLLELVTMAEKLLAFFHDSVLCRSYNPANFVLVVYYRRL